MFVCLLFFWWMYGRTTKPRFVFQVVNFQLAIRILLVWCYVHDLVLAHNTVVSGYCNTVPNNSLTYLGSKINCYSFGRFLRSPALCKRQVWTRSDIKRERSASSHLHDIADTAQTKSRLLHAYFNVIFSVQLLLVIFVFRKLNFPTVHVYFLSPRLPSSNLSTMLVVRSRIVPRVFLGILRFSSSHKNQFDQDREPHGNQLLRTTIQ